MTPNTKVHEGKFGNQLLFEGKRCAYFPTERPIENTECFLWDENYGYIGKGSSFQCKRTGIAFMCEGKKYDSNTVVFWAEVKPS